MIGVLTFFKTHSRNLLFAKDGSYFHNFFKTSKEPQLSSSIIHTINTLCAENNWIWNGELYNLPKELHTKEVVMNTDEGALIIIHIRENGKLKLIYQKGHIHYSDFQPFLMPKYSPLL